MNTKQKIVRGEERAMCNCAPSPASSSAFAKFAIFDAMEAERVLTKLTKRMTLDEAFNAKQMHNGQWKRFKVAVLSVDTLNAKQTIDGGQKGAKNEPAIFKVPVLSVSMLNQ